MAKDNLELYNKVREVPKEAQKNFNNGRFSGTDINPMWRIKELTNQFGVCGIGWYYEITNKSIETIMASDEIVANVEIKLYVKINGEWSKPIVGIGGSKLASQERKGLYVNDECVDGDCEVLTPNGWVKFKDYNGEDEVAQFNKDTGEIQFVKPSSFIHKVSKNTYRKGDIIMTYGHRNLYDTSKGARKTDTAENLCGYDGKSYFDIQSGFFGKPKELTPLQKVGIMLACDGTRYKEEDGSITWCVQFSKERKVARMRSLLNKAGIDVEYEHITKRDNPKWNDVIQVRFTLDDTDYKTYSNFIPYGNYPHLMEELMFWDGAYSQYEIDGTSNFFSVNKENIDYLQTLLALSGQDTSIYKTDGTGAKKDCYTLFRHKRRHRFEPIEKYGKETEVYCIEVPSTYFLMKKNDKIIVTGNCFKMATTDAISVACKELGFGADIYWQNDNDKYIDNKKDNVSETSNERQAVKDEIQQFVNAHGMTMSEVAKDYKLNASSTVSRLKEVLADLKGSK